MPCYDPGPTDRELRNQKVAKLIVFVNGKLNIPINEDIKELVETGCPWDSTLDKNTSYLCWVLNKLKKDAPDAFEQLVYNSRCKDSRKLADWWEEHEKFDKERKF